MPKKRTALSRKSARARRASSTSSRTKRPQLGRDLKRLVGEEVYGTWMKMLKELVPGGQTHRLSVLIAGMLHYAASCGRTRKEENSAKARLEESAWIGMDEGLQQKIILPLIGQLFKDAHVKWQRTNARGQRYSIAGVPALGLHALGMSRELRTLK